MSDDTTTLLVNGLTGEGPGDIVAAFANEADVDPGAIGAIDIDDGTATVDVRSGGADRIVQVLNGGRIGSSIVSISALDERTESARTYAEQLTDLVELEREEEMRRHEREIKTLSGREREDRSRALLRMRGRDDGEGLGGHHVKFMRENKGEPLPDHEIRVGDLVMISKTNPLRDDNPTGPVMQVTNYSITVSFDPKPDSWVFGKGPGAYRAATTAALAEQVQAFTRRVDPERQIRFDGESPAGGPIDRPIDCVSWPTQT